MVRSAIVTCLVLALMGTFAIADAGQQWLHIRVEESGEDGESVHINLPLNLVQTILPLIEVENIENGKLDLEIDELDGIDLCQIWTALREAEDGEYVTVESADENVRVAKKGEYLVIEVDGPDEQVDLRIRTAVVDALFSGDSGELDLVAALEVLGEEEECELITVQDGENHVRIWIDSRKSGK